MYGEPMTIITLGPEGTFSHELALKMGCPSISLVSTIHGIFSAVARGEGEGIVPIENSEAGGVGETLDGLLRFPVFITAEMYMPIHHYLASLVPLSRMRVIYAHPQTHEQCSGHLEKWGLPVIHTSSNASSALEAKKTPNAGAILSASAASYYKMPVLVSNIENNASNTTRFVRISPKHSPESGAQKCSIVIDPTLDRAGLLHDLLEVFSRRAINLTRIESRPSKRGMGNYVFFLDYAWTTDTCEALDELKSISTVKELGCYRNIGVPP
ncbi:MAG TPA: prephenate dehydratase domain-containing protein [Methanoregula sp.]|jgi:prephenate dehydratase|nr:prephenate dehydratase domain-containing protein [Methanoregula sp.]